MSVDTQGLPANVSHGFAVGPKTIDNVNRWLAAYEKQAPTVYARAFEKITAWLAAHNKLTATAANVNHWVVNYQPAAAANVNHRVVNPQPAAPTNVNHQVVHLRPATTKANHQSANQLPAGNATLRCAARANQAGGSDEHQMN